MNEDEEETKKLKELIAGHAIHGIGSSDELSFTSKNKSRPNHFIRYGENTKNNQKNNFNQSSSSNASIKAPPQFYRCHRCGECGHYIQDCPTNGDTTYDKKSKIKSARGIPQKFLRTISREESQNILAEDIYMKPNGDYCVIIQQTDEQMRDRVGINDHIRFTRIFSDADWMTHRELLICVKCSKLPTEAVVTKCCGAIVCRECFRTHRRRTYSCVDGTLTGDQCVFCTSKLFEKDLIQDSKLLDLIHIIKFGRERQVSSLVSSTNQNYGGNKSMGNGTLKKINKLKLNLRAIKDIKHDKRITRMVPGGPLNPFVVSNATKPSIKSCELLSEQQFLKWQQAYANRVDIASALYRKGD